jgi:putative ABC transport system ATP-binding protein
MVDVDGHLSPAARGATGVLRATVRGQRRDVVGSTLLAVGHQLSEAAVPVVVGVVLDRAVGTGDGSALALWLAVVSGVFVVLASCGAIGYWLMDRARLRAGRDVRVRVAARVLDPAGGAPGRPGEQVGLASSDADRSGQIVTAYARVASALAALVAGSAVLFSASPMLALAVLTGVPVVLGASRLLARPLVGRVEREQSTLAATTAAATDLVTGLRVLKGIGAEPAAAAGYARTSQTALRARLTAATAEGGFLSATTALTGLLLVVVAWVAGRLALAGTISIGELVAAVGLAQFLLEPLEALTRLGPLVAGARGAAGRVATFLGAPPAVTPGDTMLPEPVEGHLQIRHRGLAFDLAPGEHLGAVITDSGTAADLLDVLGRDAEPDGTVRLDGTDVTTVALAEARRALLVARHDAALFEGTLADNLHTDGSSDETALAPALAASAADDVRDSMPDGLATEIGERGRTLSGGQRQRVALARALAAEPAVLVLHDPTTAIDAATEDRIAGGLDRHRSGRGTLLVTSSPALLSRCDRVVLIADGAVTAEGTHASLVSDPAYAAAVLR